MRLYVTKYALSKGILIVDAEVSDDFPNVASIKVGLGGSNHFYGNEWHTSPEGALIQAEKMLVAKIASVRRKLHKLEKMTITIPVPGDIP